MREDKKVDFPDTRPDKAAIYIRVANENDEIVKAQEEMLLKYAEKHGYKNALIYVDNGFSGVTMDRPALNRLYEDIFEGNVRRVIVMDLSRIGRKWRDVFNWMHDLYYNDCAVLSVKDCIDDETSLFNDIVFQAYLDYLNNPSK